MVADQVWLVRYLDHIAPSHYCHMIAPAPPLLAVRCGHDHRLSAALLFCHLVSSSETCRHEVVDVYTGQSSFEE